MNRMADSRKRRSGLFVARENAPQTYRSFLRWCAFMMGIFCVVTPSADATDRDERFVEGLRARQLHELAIDYCQQRLSDQQLTASQRVDLTIELIRTQTDLAVQRVGAERTTLADQAHSTAQRLLDSTDTLPRLVLVEVQDALTHLAIGRAAMLERQVGIGNAESREIALQNLRDAIRKLEEIDEYLELEIPKRFRDAASDEELTAEQLLALRQRVKYQRGQAIQTRALLFDADDQLNRIGSLTSAIGVYGELSQSVPQDNALWWQVRVEQIRCTRLLEQLAESARLLGDLPKEAPAESIATRVILENMLLTLARGDAEAALRQGVTWIDRGRQRSPELDQAVLQSLLALAEQSTTSDAQKQRWQEQAVALSRDIESRHGPFWGRRAKLQLVGTSGNPSRMENLAILMEVGDEHYLKEEFDDALNAYQRVADLARQNQQHDDWMLASQKAGMLLQKLSDFEQASQIFRDVSLQLSDHADAAQTHQQAVWAMSQVAAKDASRLDEYRSMLEENIANWPETKVSETTRIWLGRVYEYDKQYAAAVDVYLDVLPDSELAEQAIQGAIQAANRELAAAEQQDREIDNVAANLARRLEAWIGSAGDSWTTSKVLAAIAAAKIRLTCRRDDEETAVAWLDQVLALNTTGEEPWFQQAIALRVIAYAGKADGDAQIAELIARSETSGGEQWLQTIEMIHSLSRESSGSAQLSLAESGLRVVELLSAHDALFTDEQQLRVDRLVASMLRDAGETSKAVAAYEELLVANPRNGVVLEELAEMLIESDQRELHEDALVRWRQLARGSKPQSDRWYRSKYNVALALFKLGEREEAKRLLSYLKETPPGWENSRMVNEFEDLLKRCSS